MWAPADINALPTPTDFINANRAIRMIEQDLKDALRGLAEAQRRVADLEKDLERQRAWIAPIRRVNLDILSIIFEICGSIDWRTPLRIAGVSRLWRGIVLATPGAWAHIDLKQTPNRDTILFFFHHSGQCSLHISLPSNMFIQILSGVASRTRCLSVQTLEYDEDLKFPEVQSLSVRDFQQADLTINRFPALCHLTWEADLENDFPDLFVGLLTSFPPLQTSFPPLQTLSVWMTADNTWHPILYSCQSSLISLRLNCLGWSAPSQPSITLPRLKCLEILYCPDEPGLWHFDMRTPVLESYLEYSDYMIDYPLPFHQDTEKVTHLRINRDPSLYSFPSLQVLQLAEDKHLGAILSLLHFDPDICPQLGPIEMSFWPQEIPIKIVEQMEAVNIKRCQPLRIYAVPNEHSSIPGMITSSPECECKAVY